MSRFTVMLPWHKMKLTQRLENNFIKGTSLHQPAAALTTPLFLWILEKKEKWD
jgi:hypothetical protein